MVKVMVGAVRYHRGSRPGRAGGVTAMLVIVPRPRVHIIIHAANALVITKGGRIHALTFINAAAQGIPVVVVVIADIRERRMAVVDVRIEPGTSPHRPSLGAGGRQTRDTVWIQGDGRIV